MGRARELSGQRFGRLVALEKVASGKEGNIWDCKCDCGKTTKVAAKWLNAGNTRSCGCLALDTRRTLPSGEAGFRRLFKRYRKTAVESGREFALTQDEVRELTSGRCSYCGALPHRVMKVHETGEYSHYTYNGIDRVDSSIGYKIENCVTCCWDCNVAKKDRSLEDFLAWARRVVKHLDDSNRRAVQSP